MITHELKIEVEHYDRVAQGTKTFEIRNCSDRSYQKGDHVTLRCWHDNGYTSHPTIKKQIGDVYFLVETEFCVFSLLEVGDE